jgi:hypothetical protein
LGFLRNLADQEALCQPGLSQLDVLSEQRQPFCERMFLPVEYSGCCLGQLFLIAQKRRKRDFFISTTVIQKEVLDWREV